MSEEKFYNLRIPVVYKTKLEEICRHVETECLKTGTEAPPKFKEARLGLALRFNAGISRNGRSKPFIYRLNDSHMQSLLDVIGGYYAAMRTLYYVHKECTLEQYEDAVTLMKLGERLRQTAKKQGFETPKPRLKLVENE